MDQLITQKEHASPKDVFLHLFSIVTLFASAISFLVIAFQLVNIAIPDVASGDIWGYATSARGMMLRSAIATIIVMLPLYFISLKLLYATYVANPGKRDISIRKWLTYLTLFIAICVIAGDCISLISSFLNGELTLRFCIKIVSVLLVAGGIFWYYIKDLKSEHNPLTKIFGFVVPSIVLILIIVSFFAIGSPFKERARKIDDQRENDLMMIQNYIVDYWQAKGKLPENLSMLQDDMRGVRVPTDPETNTQYAYGVKPNDTFILCAVFNDASRDSVTTNSFPDYRGIRQGSSWAHTAGKTCFERTIDKDFFKPATPTVTK